MKGKNYGMERRTFYDKKTGHYVVQLTTFPTINQKLYMHVDQFTPDSKTIIFKAHRTPDRNSPIDIFRCDVDGNNLIQMTERPDTSGACIDATGKWVYFVSSNGVLIRVHMDDLHEEEIAVCPGIHGAGCSSITDDSKYYFCDSIVNGKDNAAIKFDIERGVGEAIMTDPVHLNHVQHDPSNAGWVGIQQAESISVIRYDGSGLKTHAIRNSNGHWGWLGKTGMLFTNRGDDHNRMSISNVETGEQRDVVIADHFFWHGGSSYDGKWLVSDTNWPNEGVFLINIETGACACVADSMHYAGHPQYTHGHPSFSPDGTMIAYSSNEMGFPQVCLVSIPQTLRDKLSTK